MTTALALLGCEDQVPTELGPSNPVCGGDYSNLPSITVSLEHDLMPIFGASCTFSSCHDMSARKADLALGDPKSFRPDGGSCFDESAQWGCSIPGPIDPNLLKEVRDNLLLPSKTVKTPAIPRVTPGDPAKSFLLDKVTNTQNGRGYAQCERQDPTPSPANDCGGAMPFGDPNFCTSQTDRVTAIAAWIRDGALQN